jgi:hypothetical protein
VEQAVLPLLAAFKPDLIINSAGQDNHFTDPLANMRLSAQGYAALNKAINPDICVLEGGYSIRGALPYVNLAICLALAGLPATDIVEPDWTPSIACEKPEIMDYIATLCDAVLECYHKPPQHPHEGKEEQGWWVRRKHIFYDTDMLQEEQKESWLLCPQCSGLGRIESVCNGAPNLCLLIPRYACPQCRATGQTLAQAARATGRYAQVRLLDEDPIGAR